MSEAARETARMTLLREMERMSEERWAAGWYLGIEHMLWREMQDQNNQSEDAEILRYLHEQAGGWWIWDPRAQEAVFMVDWKPA